MKIQIKHLLHNNWDGPEIGFRIKTKKYQWAKTMRIPQIASNFLLLFTERISF